MVAERLRVEGVERARQRQPDRGVVERGGDQPVRRVEHGVVDAELGQPRREEVGQQRGTAVERVAGRAAPTTTCG